MEKCPWLLSIGMLCQQCDFLWRRGQDPLIGIYDDENAKPRYVELPVHANIPRCNVATGNTPKSIDADASGATQSEHSKSSQPSSSSSSPPQPNVSDAVKPTEVPDASSGAPSGDTKPEVSEAANEDKWEKVRSKRSRQRKRKPICENANQLCDHNLLAHNPKHPSCPICNNAKMQNAQNRRSCKKADVKPMRKRCQKQLNLLTQ